MSWKELYSSEDEEWYEFIAASSGNIFICDKDVNCVLPDEINSNNISKEGL